MQYCGGQALTPTTPDARNVLTGKAPELGIFELNQDQMKLQNLMTN